MKIRMYKIFNRDIVMFDTTFEALSWEHAITIAESKYIKLGLVGRHYLESSNGDKASISS